jgi:hypothetical protein
VRDRAKYPLDYRPTSYWTTPSDVADFSSDNQPTEVEIACIALASVLSDAISLRARRWGTRIAYRIEDE